MGLRPYISDSGARITDPTAMPMRYVVIPAMPSVSVMGKVRSMPGSAEV